MVSCYPFCHSFDQCAFSFHPFEQLSWKYIYLSTLKRQRLTFDNFKMIFLGRKRITLTFPLFYSYIRTWRNILTFPASFHLIFSTCPTNFRWTISIFHSETKTEKEGQCQNVEWPLSKMQFNFFVDKIL
jgi:hypothetical protein